MVTYLPWEREMAIQFRPNLVEKHANLRINFTYCVRTEHTNSGISLRYFPKNSASCKTVWIRVRFRTFWFSSIDFWFTFLFSCNYFYHFWSRSFIFTTMVASTRFILLIALSYDGGIPCNFDTRILLWMKSWCFRLKKRITLNVSEFLYTFIASCYNSCNSVTSNDVRDSEPNFTFHIGRNFCL